MEIIRATRRSIGGKFFIPEPFSKHELVLEAGDKIYLTTDGLMDQQSPSRHRFGSPRFIKFLNDHHGLPIEEQKRRLEEMMIGFMKIEKQRDDITIMGIKL